MFRHPNPRVNRQDPAPASVFEAGLQKGRFLLQRLPNGQCFFFPRVAAPGSGAFDFDWVGASGEGHVYATTVVRPRAPAPAYNIALIELEEGPRLMSRVENIAPEAVRIGMAVRAVVDHDNEGPILVFYPADRK